MNVKKIEMFQEDGCISHLRFPQKLWYLLSSSPNGAIMWGTFGKTILLNYNVLDGYLRCNQSIFKTSRISSFIRQLNLYGFRKVTSHLQDPMCNSSNPDLHEYMHDFFQYGKAELLNHIKRKTWNIRRLKEIVKYQPDFKMTRTYGSHRLRKARKNLQDALRRASLNYISSHQIQYEDNEELIDPLDMTSSLHWMYQNEDEQQNCLSPVNKDQSIFVHDIQGVQTEPINLTTYVETFRMESSEITMEEPYDSSQNYSIMEGDNFINDDNYGIEEQAIDYTQFLNNNNNYLMIENADNCDSQDSVTFEKENNDEEEPKTAEEDLNMNYVNEVVIEKSHVENIKIEPDSPVEETDFDEVNSDHDVDSYRIYPAKQWDHCQTSNEVVALKQLNSEMEYGTELKELYTQISKSIDLLNSS